jgi:hypothetical protein
MEQSPYWEDKTRLTTSEFFRLLRKSKVHYYNHNSPPLVLILSHFNPLYIPLYLFNIHFNMLRLYTRFPHYFFPTGFWCHFYHKCHMYRQSRHPWLDNPEISGENYTLRNSSVFSSFVPFYFISKNQWRSVHVNRIIQGNTFKNKVINVIFVIQWYSHTVGKASR